MSSNPASQRARQLRQTSNAAEQTLWSVLRGRQLAGWKFTRQMPIGPYVADFVCRCCSAPPMTGPAMNT
jgi:very-short-patch-repair endonuclease